MACQIGNFAVCWSWEKEKRDRHFDGSSQKESFFQNWRILTFFAKLEMWCRIQLNISWSWEKEKRERHFDGFSQREIFQRHYAKCIKEETLVHCTSLLLKTLPANTHSCGGRGVKGSSINDVSLSWLNSVPTRCCHMILIYRLILPSAGRNRVKPSISTHSKPRTMPHR